MVICVCSPALRASRYERNSHRLPDLPPGAVVEGTFSAVVARVLRHDARSE